MIIMTYKQILLTGGLSLLLATITYFLTPVPKVVSVKMNVHVGEDK